MRKKRGKCITCGELIGLSSYFAVMHKGRARSEHSSCHREKEVISRILAWMDAGIEYQARTVNGEWDEAYLEANRDIRTDLANGTWRKS